MDFKAGKVRLALRRYLRVGTIVAIRLSLRIRPPSGAWRADRTGGTR
jgi:hypothetical protein